MVVPYIKAAYDDVMSQMARGASSCIRELPYSSLLAAIFLCLQWSKVIPFAVQSSEESILLAMLFIREANDWMYVYTETVTKLYDHFGY